MSYTTKILFGISGTITKSIHHVLSSEKSYILVWQSNRYTNVKLYGSQNIYMQQLHT